MSDLVRLKECIRSCAYSAGADKIGFTDARPLEEHLERLLRRRDGVYRFALSEGDPYKRINPLLHMPEAKSVICVAKAYSAAELELPERAGLDVEGKRGRVSYISRGTDYHIIMGGILERLREFIRSEVPGARVLTMVDKEELLEKAFAVKAGLGWFGKNTLLVTPEYGSFIFLGELITDVPFPPDLPSGPGGCGECRKCIDSCPARALGENGELDPDRCLSSLTQSRLLPPPELRELIGNSIYGCDVCQTACPHCINSAKARQASAVEQDDACPRLVDLLTMTNTGFRRRFGRTSGGWRGKNVFRRNAVIAAGNLKDESVVPEIARVLEEDRSPGMRSAAAWALGRIRTPEAIAALKMALKNEQNLDVIREIRESLLQI